MAICNCASVRKGYSRQALNGYIVFAALTLVGAASSSLPAATTTFTTRAAWEGTVGSFSTENFANVPIQTPLPPRGGGTITIVTPAFEISADGNHPLIGSISIRSVGFVNGSREFQSDVHGPGSPFGAIPSYNRFEFNSPIKSFAADLAMINEGGVQLLLAGATLDLPDGTNFIGVTSDVPFSVVEFRATGDQEEVFSVDNISFQSIPEPELCSMLIMAGLFPASRLVRRRMDC
jgi:hypothetical protein